MSRARIEPFLIVFRCPRCGRWLEALRSAEVRCKCGQETAQAVTIGRETAVISAKSRPKTAVQRKFDVEKRSL